MVSKVELTAWRGQSGPDGRTVRHSVDNLSRDKFVSGGLKVCRANSLSLLGGRSAVYGKMCPERFALILDQNAKGGRSDPSGGRSAPLT